MAGETASSVRETVPGEAPAIVEQRHARVAEIDALTRRTLAELAKLYDELLPYPDKAEALKRNP
jgi:hypothetical protein